MPRIDDYKEALGLVRNELADKNPDLIAGFSGATINRDQKGNTSLFLDFLNREIMISWPDMACSYANSDESISIQQQILILHYLKGTLSSSGSVITGEWITFQDVPDGKFYMDAFQRRAKNPMVQAFGNCPEVLADLAAKAFDASISDQGDLSIVIKAFPLVPVTLILWRGDEEFPPEGNVLFDKNISGILSAEDIAWLAGMIIYPLIGMAKG
ncbi:MAG: DUF3786 domain-containing protein [Thermodesulfobacteriota bacterium]|nr:DUF3786 domain-containing protein [Thermodesulfobacteriota bacterium]